jgi:hypothetical protein
MKKKASPTVVSTTPKTDWRHAAEKQSAAIHAQAQALLNGATQTQAIQAGRRAYQSSLQRL